MKCWKSEGEANFPRLTGTLNNEDLILAGMHGLQVRVPIPAPPLPSHGVQLPKLIVRLCSGWCLVGSVLCSRDA